MLNYIEKGHRLHSYIESQGHWIKQKDNIWISSDDIAVQAIIDSYDPIPDYKEDKVEELKQEGLRRIQLIFPAINSIDELDLFSEFYLSIAPAARNPTPDFQTVINIRQAGKNALQFINSLTTEQEIKSYDVVNTPSWP